MAEKINNSNINNSDVKKAIKAEAIPEGTVVPLEKKSNDNDILKRLSALESSISKKDELILKQNSVIEKLSATNNSGNSMIGNVEFVELLKLLKENNQPPKRELVKIIHLDNCNQSQFKLPNEVITFRSCGEVYPTNIETAEILLNKFTDTFRRGALCFDNEHMYLLEEKGIDITKINYNAVEEVKNVANLDIDGLTSLYNGLQYFQQEMLKSQIIGEIKKGNYEYMSMDKLRHLNKLSNGGYKYIIDTVEKNDGTQNY